MKKMKKLTAVAIMVIFSCFLIFSASIKDASAKEVPITEENIHLLKGRWEGYGRGVSQKIGGRSVELPIESEIVNDCAPLKGTLIYYKMTGGNLVLPFDNGVIENGKLLIRWDKEKHWVHLKLDIKSGKVRLKGQNHLGWDLFFLKKT